ncbi:5096_t:CDS:2, partial [Racocetra fulgida]
IHNNTDQKELITECYSSEEESSTDTFCRKLQQLDVDTSQSNSDDQCSKLLQNRSPFACIRLSDALCNDTKPTKSINSSVSVDNNTPHSIENHSECDKTLQHNHTSSNSYIDMKQSTNTSVYQLRHRRASLPKPLIEPITKQETKSLSTFSDQKKSLKNQIKNTLPTRSNPKRSSTISLPSYENLQKLEAHEQTVHPYRCHYQGCSSRFDRLDYAKKHMQTHTDIFPRECEVPGCGTIYFTRKSYQSHLMKHGKLERMRSQIEVEKPNRSKNVNNQKKNYVREKIPNTKEFIARNKKDKVSANNKKNGVHEDSKRHKVNKENKRCRVNVDNESSEVSVDRVVIVITDINT